MRGVGKVLSPAAAARRVARAAALALALTGPAVVHGQLLADVLTTTAIVATFDSGVRFPSGTLRAVGAGVDDLVRRLPGNGDWTDWEAYIARGLAANLRPAFVHNIITSMASAGYFEDSRETRTVAGPNGQETQTKVTFVDFMGTSWYVLYVVEAGDEVAWLIGRAR
jgi:hypothetical protein